MRLGSSIRSKGIFQFVRLRLPSTSRKNLTVKAGELSLALPEDKDAEPLIGAVSKALEGIEDRPILPREIEDILSIKSSERHRWLKDGRLPSAGTKTVKLRGERRRSPSTYSIRKLSRICSIAMPSLNGASRTP